MELILVASRMEFCVASVNAICTPLVSEQTTSKHRVGLIIIFMVSTIAGASVSSEASCKVVAVEKTTSAVLSDPEIALILVTGPADCC